MEGRKEGRITSPGRKTRTTLTHPDKSVTIATLKRPTGSRIRRVETQRKKGCVVEDVGECNTAYRVPTSPALVGWTYNQVGNTHVSWITLYVKEVHVGRSGVGMG